MKVKFYDIDAFLKDITYDKDEILNKVLRQTIFYSNEEDYNEYEVYVLSAVETPTDMIVLKHYCGKASSTKKMCQKTIDKRNLILDKLGKFALENNLILRGGKINA